MRNFWMQAVISSVVVGLCVYKLSTPITDGDKTIYWSGLTSIVGYWLPAPGNSDPS
jgi:hypothetical protein